MNLDSVRSLKSELMTTNLWQGIAAPAVSALATRVMAVSATRPRLPLAMGIRGTNGAYKLAIRVQKAVPGLDGILERIGRRARGEVQIRMVGNVFKQVPWHQKRNRPLRIGGSIGHVKITAGTLGCFVTPRSGDGSDDFILSNNHVLANENVARRGDPVLQPGPVDGGRKRRDVVVGHLGKFIRLKRRNNVVDAAVASLTDNVEYYYNWLENLGPIRGLRSDPIDEGDIVYKVGRTTGVTKGRVSAIEVDALDVEYDMGDITFNRQIEIEPIGPKPFSRGGDSGSLIVDSRRRAVGLLFAGNDVDATYANPIQEVLDQLKMKLIY